MYSGYTQTLYKKKIKSIKLYKSNIYIIFYIFQSQKRINLIQNMFNNFFFTFITQAYQKL